MPNGFLAAASLLRPRCSILILALLLGTVASPAQPAAPGTLPAVPPPLPPVLKSPTELFRKLLSADASQREELLRSRPPASREIILRGLREYESLSPTNRELRLRTLELGWHLDQLFRMSPTNREPWLASLSESDRTALRNRARYWDSLSPTTRTNLLQNQLGIRALIGLDTLVEGGSVRVHRDIQHLKELTSEQRQELVTTYKLIFELSNDEKNRLLQIYDATQREQMMKTLKQLGAVPAGQRDLCLDGMTRFNTLSPEEKIEFLKNCERWKSMTPTEREAWRVIVRRQTPRPPLPPLVPPRSASKIAPSQALTQTN
jgi:hypothetical protein